MPSEADARRKATNFLTRQRPSCVLYRYGLSGEPTDRWDFCTIESPMGQAILAGQPFDGYEIAGYEILTRAFKTAARS